MTSHLVIGAGEVGCALAELLGCDIRDVEDRGDLRGTYDMLHICMPWQIEDFVGAVAVYKAHYQATYVVVHSTVPPETCDPRGWTHSPVRGKHPDLASGLQAFAKHYGGAQADAVAELLSDYFPDYYVHEFATTTETAKLWELVSYGVEISMMKLIYGYCAKMDLDPQEVYSLFGATYNNGWLELGCPEYMKPILTEVPGPIGGHCVVAGAKMLNDHHRHVLPQLVLMVQKELEGS